MKKIKFIWFSAIISSLIYQTGCRRVPDVGILNTGNFTDVNTPLKEAADFPIGCAISYSPFLNDQNYANIAKRDFDEVVFEYQMKHGAIVQDNGNFNFTNTDALVNAVGSMGIFGHTLVWHQNNNANYLKSYAGITLPAPTELLTNGGFENNLSNWSQFNTGNPAGSSSFTITTTPGEFRSGSRALRVFVNQNYGTQQWRVQLASDPIPMDNGKTYRASLWIRCASAGGSMRMSLNPDNSASPSSYQADQDNLGTSWQQITFTFTKTATVPTRIVLDMGKVANTYFIDDISVTEVITPPGGAEIANKLDTAMRNFITAMVNRYKSKVRAWDVVNEPFADNPVAIRNNSNTSTTANDVLVWSHYMGRNWALKAFNYARAADPTADLYINDYNLESNPAKLDSLIAFVNELKAAGAKVDGIGTQMHITRNTSYAGIDNMMKKLGATGLKIRISELDVRAVLGNASGKLTPELAAHQAVMYKYVVQSYLKHIPKAQQAGITVWGIVDKYSWLYNNGAERPLLYDDNYEKKPAYAGFLQGLKGQ
ncbi:MAG: endo-1,4-beta-xylanase [Chitinophagaceae bacterium]|nr:endo-1,4-beta-xylanase [Chitinophagaceae bacterium]